MPRGKNELKTSNINYIGRDFTDLKTSEEVYNQNKDVIKFNFDHFLIYF